MKTETASAVIARPSVRFEHLIGAVTLVERRLAAEPEGGVALIVDGEGMRCGHCQKRQAKGGDQHRQAMTGRRRRQKLHDGLMHVRKRQGSLNNMATWRRTQILAALARLAGSRAKSGHIGRIMLAPKPRASRKSGMTVATWRAVSRRWRSSRRGGSAGSPNFRCVN